MIILLDGGPLGLVSNPKATGVRPCREWMKTLIKGGAWVCLPETIDYEPRRELLRANKAQGLARLDLLKSSIHRPARNVNPTSDLTERWNRGPPFGMLLHKKDPGGIKSCGVVTQNGDGTSKQAEARPAGRPVATGPLGS